MNSTLRMLSRKLGDGRVPAWAVPACLLILAFVAYGSFFLQLGFYWDDLPISWIRYQFGADAMRLYFATSRPVWGMLYQVTTRLLPDAPAPWQLLAVFWRWVTALVCWLLFKQLWPRRLMLAFITSLCFLLYPGWTLQWAAFLSAHFLIVLTLFLVSYVLMFLSFRPPRWLPTGWPFSVGALICSALNVWMMEYFFFLELVRPLFIFAWLRENGGEVASSSWRRVHSAALRWLPYLVIWLANIAYRKLVFTNLAYGNALLGDLRSRPLTTGLELLGSVARDVWLVSVQAWAQVFQFPNPSHDGPLTILFYVAVVLAAGILTAFLLARLAPAQAVGRHAWIWPVGLGLAAMLLAGGPYWLASLELTLGFPANRFTISFMLGVSLLLAGLLELFPVRARVAVVAVLVGLAAGRQALWADSFRRDWTAQKTMFWQMLWRAPGLQPDTMVLLNEGPLHYYADNSLGAALNWIYDPDQHTAPMHYALFFPLSRLGGTLHGLAPDQPVVYTTYWVTAFYGNTSQVVAMYYQPPGCLRVLDPQMDAANRLIPDDSMMRDAAALSSSHWILSTPLARMPAIYGPEPVHGWCYYFERAELAAQSRDWGQVVKLGDQALALDDYPNDPVERFVFIEGYAANGNWARAKELAIQSYKVSPNIVGPLLCTRLKRMERDLVMDGAGKSSLNELRTKFSCLP